jgi:hypothetical protein
MRLRYALVFPLACLLHLAAHAQTTTAAPQAAPADPAARAKAEADAVRARAAAALKARAEAEQAAKQNAGSGMTAPVAPAQLVYGDYACTYNTWNMAERRMVFTPKGAVQLNANGTYRYLDGGTVGRYAYNANTRQITWITGYFAEAGQPKTTFAPGEKTAQLDIEFKTANGPLNWSCGCNRK